MVVHKRQVAWILTLLLNKASPDAFNHAPCLLISIFALCSILAVHYKFIGIVWHHSYIKIDLPVYPF
jgi:hypothetical protein